MKTIEQHMSEQQDYQGGPGFGPHAVSCRQIRAALDLDHRYRGPQEANVLGAIMETLAAFIVSEPGQ